MSMIYLGILEYADPLYEILFSQELYPDVKDPIFHVSRTQSFPEFISIQKKRPEWELSVNFLDSDKSKTG